MDVLMGLVLKNSSHHRSLKLLRRVSRLRIGEPHLTCGKNEVERSLGLGRNRGKEIIYGMDWITLHGDIKWPGGKAGWVSLG